MKSFSVPFLPTLEDWEVHPLSETSQCKTNGHGRQSSPDEVRGAITRLKAEGFTVSEVSEKIIDAYGISVSFEALKRWAERHVGKRHKTAV